MTGRFSAALLCVAPALAAAQPAAWQPDNRVILSGHHDTLTGTTGGEGGSLTYLGEPSAAALLGVGAEYQKLAGADWAFASLDGAYNHALTTRSRWNVHAEAHEGTGRSASVGGGRRNSFDYSIVAAGVGVSVPGGLSADLEERQVDVQSSHGSLPKLTLSQAFGRRVLTTLSYARSYGGNLDTSFGAGRIDVFGPGFSVLAGGSVGRVTPAVINIAGVLTTQTHHLREVFLGVTKPIARVDLTLLGDDLDLEGIRRVTVTLNITIHLR